MIISLPKWLAKGTTMPRGEPIYLSVDIPQSAIKGKESKAPSPGSHSIPILNASPTRAPLPKVGGWVSMTMEVRELLSWVALDTSGQASGSSTLNKLEPMVLVTSLPPSQKISPNWWVHLPKWAPQMKVKWTTPPQRRSLPPTPLHSKPWGPAVTSLP